MPASPPPARSDGEAAAFVRRHLRRNIAVQLANGMLGQTGVRLAQAPTFLPAYLFALSGSEFVVGLARSLQAAAEVVSPALGASIVGHRHRMLRPVLICGLLQRLQVLVLGLAGLLLPDREAVVVILAALALMGFFHGAQMVMQDALRAKVIPVRMRGIIAGWRQFLAGLCTAGVSYFAGGYFIDHDVLGDGYAALFLLAFALTAAGLVSMALTAEPDAESVRPRASLFATFAGLRLVLRQDPAFFRFFVARGLGAFGRMAMPFYVLFAGTRMELGGVLLGTLTTVWLLTSATTNLLWGIAADRHGYRIVMIATLALWGASHVQLLFVDGFGGMLVFYVIMGMASGGFFQAGQNMTLEFGRSDEIPLRAAAMSTLQNAIGTVGPLAGGVVAAAFSYEWLFVLTGALLFAALAVVVVAVPEPRQLHATARL
jgi:MFS family permease